MSELLQYKPETEIGVIIARFQVPKLHAGHVELIQAIMSIHPKVIVLLGTAPLRVTRKNPLDYMTRELMLKSKFPTLSIQPLPDRPSDKDWSELVDDKIRDAVGGTPVTLYGSRDSFIPHYMGKYPTKELPETKAISGKQVRDQVSKEIRAEEAFRRGVIYAAYQRYPALYQTVDIVVWRNTEKGPEILLGRKKTDLPGKWRFIGGFIDPQDESLELAAARECSEETGSIATHPPVYSFSHRVDDWRYRNQTDGIMTAVFFAEYFFGAPKASDDLHQLEWFPVSVLSEVNLVPDHAGMWEKVKAKLEG